jgi:hypothetical protein
MIYCLAKDQHLKSDPSFDPLFSLVLESHAKNIYKISGECLMFQRKIDSVECNRSELSSTEDFSSNFIKQAGEFFNGLVSGMDDMITQAFSGPIFGPPLTIYRYERKSLKPEEAIPDLQASDFFESTSRKLYRSMNVDEGKQNIEVMAEKIIDEEIKEEEIDDYSQADKEGYLLPPPSHDKDEEVYSNFSIQ